MLLVEEEPGSGFETARSPAPAPDLDALENHMLWNSATQKSVLKRVGFRRIHFLVQKMNSGLSVVVLL